jgi:hypothetical protein
LGPCCLVGAILKILCPRERRVFQSKVGVSSSNQCNKHHSPHTGQKLKRVQSFSDILYSHPGDLAPRVGVVYWGVGDTSGLERRCPLGSNLASCSVGTGTLKSAILNYDCHYFYHFLQANAQIGPKPPAHFFLSRGPQIFHKCDNHL